MIKKMNYFYARKKENKKEKKKVQAIIVSTGPLVTETEQIDNKNE